MSRPELGALLVDASEHLSERDFVDEAWESAFGRQRSRRRGWTGAASAAALAALAVVAVQVAGGHGSVPTPGPSPTTSADPHRLADGTAYAQLPLEGKESGLTYFAAGLPPAIDLDAATVALSPRTALRTPLAAVYLRSTGTTSYQPVLVPASGHPVLADDLTLAIPPTGDPASVLGPQAIDAHGRFVVFAQPGRVVRLDAQSGATTSYAVPSQQLREVGWGADGLIVARDDEQAWTLDPTASHPQALPAAGREVGRFRLSTGSGGLRLARADGAGGRAGQRVPAPVTQISGATVSNDQRAASVAFFDQNLTHPVIQRGNGPIYQGLVSVDTEARSARVLLAPESPDGRTGRVSPCCTVLGWADATTVLFTAVGRHGRWVLGWNTASGEVYEAVRLVTRAPDEPVVPLAVHLGGS
jgi:hypothetical protein